MNRMISANDNHAFLILTDCVSESMMRLYLQIEAATASFGKTFIVYHNKAEATEVRLKKYNTYEFTDAILNDLEYTPITNTLVPGSNHFPVLKFYLDHPEYNYYWCIEDDVVFTGEWFSFFDQVINKVDYDFISSKIMHYREMGNNYWTWWGTLSKAGREINLNDLVKSFNPIYSLSTAAAEFLDKSLKSGWSGHHEVLMPSLLYAHGFRIKDFGGNGTFVPKHFRNKFYIEETHLFRPAFSAPGKLLNKIYHPVKSQLKISADYQHKISYCITGAGLLDKLRQTLQKNIQDNENYENCEFVIFDYVPGNLDHWIKDHMQIYLDNGKLIYVKTYQTKFYNLNRAKNILTKVSTGEIICHMDAGQLTGKKLSKDINEQFKLNNQLVFSDQGYELFQKEGNLATLRKLIFKKRDFLRINGFDEQIQDGCHGITDFIGRLIQVRITLGKVDDRNVLHSEELTGNFPKEVNYLSLSRILVHYLNPSTTKVIFMYYTGDFEFGVITNNANIGHADFRYAYSTKSSNFEYLVKSSRWKKGKWKLTDDGRKFIFQFYTGEQLELEIKRQSYQTCAKDHKETFFSLTDPEMLERLIDFNFQSKNNKFFKSLKLKSTYPINPTGFGEAIVNKNLNLDLPYPIN